jgi:4-amino-4-deoxy-L-arabinose transferase-like glycosyltransferase
MSLAVRAWWARAAALFPRAKTRLVGAERVMHWLAIAACVFFAAVAFWESFGPARGGHFGANAAYAMAGENMVRWHKFGVFCGYLARPATTDQFYYHHPYGMSVLDAIAFLVFGHHWFTTRAAAIFCSVISAPLVYGIGRRAWGVIPASVATLFFVFVPIDLAFIGFGNLEVPTIAFGLLFAWATVRLWDEWKTRHLVLAAIGALGACNGDWVGLVFIGTVVIFGFFRAYLFPRQWYGRLDDRGYARWFAYVTAMAIGTLLLYLTLFGKADKLADMMGSYHMRSTGSDDALTDVISRRRKLWLGVMFTPIAYGVLGAGFPLACLRLVRKPLEIFGIAWALAATFQYLVFKQGADIHIFWPHYYAPAVALLAGTLARTLLDGREALMAAAARVSAVARTRVVAYGTGAFLGLVFGVPLLLLARTGLSELVQSRKTGGRFDQGGHWVGTDADLAQFAKWAVSNVATAGSTVQALEKIDFSFHVEYGVDRPYVRVSSLTSAKLEDPQRIAIVDTRNQSTKDLETIAKQFSVEAAGPFWRVDRAVKGPLFKALRYVEREPNPFEWLFISGTDLVRTISRDEDEYATWEWRDALGLPNTAPTAAPVTVDDLRIAHNVAVSAKDTARAAELSARLVDKVGTPRNLSFTGGVRLQGIDIHMGPAIVVTMFWETDASFKHADATFQVKCNIAAPPRLWVTNTDYYEKDMAPVAIIRPAVWKPGYLYTQRFIAEHRIGREECMGSFSSDYRFVGGATAPMFLFE